MTAAFRKTITFGQLLSVAATLLISICGAGFTYYKSTNSNIQDLQTNQELAIQERKYMQQTLTDIKNQLSDIRKQQADAISLMYELKAALNNKQDRR